jgi:hypothetical protein
MRLTRGARAVAVASLLTLALGIPAVHTQTEEPQSAKTWLGKAAEFEEYLRTAEVVKVEKIGVGVTNPSRAYLKPGGPFESMAWKPIRPGIYQGFWESYKSEIAAYELDKLLELNMVPPTIERRVNNDLGAAIMWCTPTKSFKEFGGSGVPTAPGRYFVSFNRQVVITKMFDNLIGNIDPNLGNWLVDPAWNLILIDHTRAFTSTKKLYHAMTRIDGPVWEKMQGLTEESLAAALGKWLGKGEIRDILERRKKMQEEIGKLIKDKGEAAVVIK